MNKLKNLSLIILVLSAILIPILFGNFMTLNQKIVVYTIGYVVKNIFIAILPALLLPFVIKSFKELEGAGVYLTFILVMVMLSNFTAVFVSYLFGINFIPYISIPGAINIHSASDPIQSLYSFNIPEYISIPQTIALGIVMGLTFGYVKLSGINSFVNSYYRLSYTFLSRVFIYIIPIYIFGTMFKITHEVDFMCLIGAFGKIVILFVILQILHITFMFLLGCKFNISKTISVIKTTLPAGLVAFSTMSSLVTLPITLRAARINTNNSSITDITITSTVNYNDIGELISIPMIALTIIYITQGIFPTFTSYLIFAFAISLAQFSSVSVPSGSITIITPLLTKYLGFTDEMTALLITIAICTEPIGTAANVMGNSAFVLVIDRIRGSIAKSNLAIILLKKY